MPRHSTFELKDTPLHQKGKILRMSKAYTNQDFAKPTVRRVSVRDIFLRIAWESYEIH